MNYKILIADDEKDILEVMAKKIKASGYKVITAHDGEAAWEKIQKEDPDVILLDLTMPKMDGFNVCRILKYDKKFQDTPIIMLTARDQDIDKKSGGDVRADAYLTKPYDSKELMNKIKEFIGDA